MKKIYDADDYNIKHIDIEFIEKYELWLKTERNCSHNTAMKYLVDLKKILLICRKRNWLTHIPFSEFNITNRKIKKTPFTQEQIDAVAKKQFASERLRVVRDIFLFCCYTGLPYCEVKNLIISQIFIGIDGL